MASKIWLMLFFTFIFILFIHPLEGDGDFYHHINTGRYTLNHFSLPRVDEWTFTEHGKSWVAHSWAAGLLFYLIYSSFGVAGISIFVALIGLLTLFLTYLLMKSYHLKKQLTYPLLLILVSLLLIRFPARPEIFAYPFLISILLINRLGTKYPRLYFLYPLIIFLWSIFYGANVLVGLILLVLLTITAYARKASPFEPKLIILSLLSFLLSLLNGYGLDSIFYILKIRSISQIQGEWLGILSIFQKAPPDFLYLFKFRLLIYSMLLLLYLGLVIIHIKLIRNHIWEFVLSLSVFLPVFTFRQVPLATVLTLPLLALTIGSYKTLNLKFTIYLWTLVSLSILLTLFYNPPKLGFTEDPARMRLISFISDNKISGNAYTSQQVGSFISFKFYPKILVSYDTRDDLFIGGKFLRDSLSGAPMELILQRYHADLIILDTNEDSQKTNYLLHSPNWVKVYFKDNFLVMIRK